MPQRESPFTYQVRSLRALVVEAAEGHAGVDVDAVVIARVVRSLREIEEEERAEAAEYDVPDDDEEISP
jgi:hypothetical protein